MPEPSLLSGLLTGLVGWVGSRRGRYPHVVEWVTRCCPDGGHLASRSVMSQPRCRGSLVRECAAPGRRHRPCRRRGHPDEVENT
ncbi:PEP-CTERM sorting domain-containing protein [Streptosporangium album]|uniref:PEP-CTERM sorting domain-containing protein n=1 Tax=Streptosporangium album TaxID=47479 RepID=UPI001610D157